MTIPVLVPCPSCARHIATSEATCPFCASAVPEDLAARAIPANNRRLSRFAMFTFATTATTITALSACGNSEMSSTFYGQPCTDADPCSTFDDGSAVGLYGMPGEAGSFDSGPPDDASFIDADGGDAGDAIDASEDAD